MQVRRRAASRAASFRTTRSACSRRRYRGCAAVTLTETADRDVVHQDTDCEHDPAYYEERQSRFSSGDWDEQGERCGHRHADPDRARRSDPARNRTCDCRAGHRTDPDRRHEQSHRPGRYVHGSHQEHHDDRFKTGVEEVPYCRCDCECAEQRIGPHVARALDDLRTQAALARGSIGASRAVIASRASTDTR